MDTSAEIERELNILMQELIAAYDAKGMRASGRWADSLQVEVNGTRGILTGLQYTEQLQYGRRAGRFPPVEQIEQWIRDKGIQAIDASINIRTLAFLIARKISREGWNRQGFGGVELVDEVLTPARIQQALDNISLTAATVLSEMIMVEFSDLNV